MPFQDQPFNGDTHICSEFLKLKKEYGIEIAVETGSCLYTTTKWFAENFDRVYTIEISEQYASCGRHKISDFQNVTCDIGSSENWIPTISERLNYKRVIFFLDAHWGNVCPLISELQGISALKSDTPPIITIHDFYTGNAEFGYDEYNGQPFTYEWIEPYIKALEQSFSCKYEHYYNTEAVGAKRGIIYIKPSI